MPRWKAPCRNAAQEEEAAFPATPIPIFYQEPTDAYLPPYDRPDMLHQGRPHPPFSLPHHHRHKRVIASVIPRKEQFFPSQEISYHTEPAQWPLRPQRKLKSRSNSSSGAVESRIIVFPGFLSSAGMSGSSEARIPQSRETRNIRSPPYDPGANG